MSQGLKCSEDAPVLRGMALTWKKVACFSSILCPAESREEEKLPRSNLSHLLRDESKREVEQVVFSNPALIA